MIVISSSHVSSFTPIPSHPRNINIPSTIYHEQSSSLHASAAAMPDGPNDDKKQNQQQQQEPEKTTNFLPLESHPPSPQRLSRIEQEAKTRSRFLHGDELIELRKYVSNLELDLQFAKDKKDMSRIRDLTKALYDSKNLDAEYVYTHCMEMAESADSEEEILEWKNEANEARDCLPQFNLQGLWVGK